MLELTLPPAWSGHDDTAQRFRNSHAGRMMQNIAQSCGNLRTGSSWANLAAFPCLHRQAAKAWSLDPLPPHYSTAPNPLRSCSKSSTSLLQIHCPTAPNLLFHCSESTPLCEAEPRQRTSHHPSCPLPHSHLLPFLPSTNYHGSPNRFHLQIRWHNLPGHRHGTPATPRAHPCLAAPPRVQARD